MSRRTLITCLAAGILFTAGAGEACARRFVAAGTLHSPKASGLAFRFDHGDRIYDLSLAADLYGVLRQPDGKPGCMLSLYYNPILYRTELPEGGALRFFAGPGVSTGWVADSNGGGFGLATTLNADCGLSFDFARQVSAVLSLNAGFGLHAVRGDDGSSLVRLYRNGLLRALYPEARLLYRFGELRGSVARAPRHSLVYGVENNLYALLYARTDVDFHVEEGYRVHDIGRVAPKRVAGEILAFAGYRFSPWFSLALYAGYAGEYRDTRMFPVSLRATVQDGRGTKGAALAFVDAGAAVSERAGEKAGLIAKIGAGYRWALGGGASLQLTASARWALLHPQLYDPMDGHWVPPAQIFRNNVYVFSTGLGVALQL